MQRDPRDVPNFEHKSPLIGHDWAACMLSMEYHVVQQKIMTAFKGVHFALTTECLGYMRNLVA